MSDRQAKLARAQARREALERQAHAQALRRRRIQMLAGLAALAILVVVVAVIVSSGGGGKGAPKLRAGARPPQSAAVNAMFAGIPQQNQALGRPTAPLTLVEFADLKCPVCREYTLRAFPTLLDRYVRTGKLRIVFEPQTFVGQPPGDSEHAARFALAAGQQDRLWQFAELWYRNQQDENVGYATTPYIRQIASGVRGLDVSRAMALRDSPQVTAELRAASQRFDANGFNGTPSFLLGRTGGRLRPLNALVDPSEFVSAIDGLLKAG